MVRSILSSILLALVFLCFLTACSPLQDRQAAEQVVAGYFQAVQAHDFNRATDFYAPVFFQHTPREKWIATLKSLNTKLGDLKGNDLDTWREDSRAGVGSEMSGTFVTLRYHVTYTKHPSVETFVVQKQPGSADWKIVSQDIQSDALLSQ